jgi:hypothetical protein
MKKRNFYQSKGIHANAPKRLVRAYHKAGWNMRELERMLNEMEPQRVKVNYFYIHALIVNGTEPTDQTESGRAVRLKLFLARRKRKARRVEGKPREQKPEWLREWNRKPKDDKLKVIRALMTGTHTLIKR